MTHPGRGEGKGGNDRPDRYGAVGVGIGLTDFVAVLHHDGRASPVDADKHQAFSSAVDRRGGSFDLVPQ